MGLGRVGTVLPSTPLRLTSLAAATLGWLYVVIDGLGEAVADETLAHLWGHGAIWPLLAAVAAGRLAAPTSWASAVPPRWSATRSRRCSERTSLVLGALDNSLTDATLSLMLCVVAWTVVAAARAAEPATGRRPAARRCGRSPGRGLPRPGRQRPAGHARCRRPVHAAVPRARRPVLALGVTLAGRAHAGRPGCGRLRRGGAVVSAPPHGVARRCSDPPQPSVRSSPCPCTTCRSPPWSLSCSSRRAPGSRGPNAARSPRPPRSG